MDSRRSAALECGAKTRALNLFLEGSSGTLPGPQTPLLLRHGAVPRAWLHNQACSEPLRLPYCHSGCGLGEEEG